MTIMRATTKANEVENELHINYNSLCVFVWEGIKRSMNERRQEEEQSWCLVVNQIQFHNFSMENQWHSMTFSYQRNEKSYTTWWKFLSFTIKLFDTKFSFSMTFGMFLVFHDFSRPGNTFFFQIPWLFQVFHDCMNPTWNNFKTGTLTLPDHWSQRCKPLRFSDRLAAILGGYMRVYSVISLYGRWFE